MKHHSSDSVAEWVRKGADNVFEDLGFSKVVARELRIKAGLTFQICYRIKSLRLTKVQVAKLMRISQPTALRLIEAKPTRFSIDKLLALLNALEVDIDIVVRPKVGRGTHKPGVVRILEAARIAS